VPIVLKSAAEIAKMRAAGKLAAEAHELLRRMLAPGLTTGHLDRAAHDFIVGRGGYPSFLGFNGFPGSICASINEEVLHGIPGERALADGDIISIDIGVVLDGYQGDTARTWAVGTVSEAASVLIADTEACFWHAAPLLRDGARLGDYAAAAQAFAEARGYGVVRGYSGHGVGRKMHEDPDVPNWGRAGSGALLRSGMTLAVEPMLTLGSAETRVLDDDWTVVTADGSPAAHFEHTLVVQGDHPVVLTALDERVL
jgi:methionyl aminopeptidase